MSSNPLHSNGDPDWITPPYILDAARHTFGGTIDLDPMSSEEANAYVKADRIFTREYNAFLHAWDSPAVWLNPSGDCTAEAWCYLVDQYLNDQVGAAIYLGYSIEQLQSLQKTGVTPLQFAICVPKARISFIENEARRIARETHPDPAKRKKHGPTHANFLAYLGSDPRHFADAFADIGAVKI